MDTKELTEFIEKNLSLTNNIGLFHLLLWVSFICLGILLILILLNTSQLSHIIVLSSSILILFGGTIGVLRNNSNLSDRLKCQFDKLYPPIIDGKTYPVKTCN